MIKRLTALFGILALFGLITGSADAAALKPPTSPCGVGGYYGGGDEIPPGSGGVYGALLLAQADASVSLVDLNGDRWNCWGPGVFQDNEGTIPEPRNYADGEQIVQGDVMGPPLGGGLCCDGSLAINLSRNTFHAAGYSDLTSSRFDSTRVFHWDANDIFYVDGTLTTMRAFERSLGEGDVFSAVYAARAGVSSVWSFYNHEV